MLCIVLPNPYYLFIRIDRQGLAYQFSLRIEQLIFNRCRACQLGTRIEYSFVIIVIERSNYLQILNVKLFIPRIQETITRHTAQSPEILVLAPRAVAPAEHLKRNQVLLASLHEWRDVELGSHFRVLGIADELAVHVEIDARSDASEVRDDLFSVPVGRNRERAAIRTHVVVLHGHSRRFSVEMSFPRETRIDINRVAVAVHFPNAGHGNRSPTRIVEIRLEKVGGTLVAVLHPVEFPRAMQRQEVFRLRAVAFQCQLLVFVGEKRGVQRQSVDFIHVQVLDFGHRRLNHPCRNEFRGLHYFFLRSLRAEGQSREGGQKQYFFHCQ